MSPEEIGRDDEEREANRHRDGRTPEGCPGGKKRAIREDDAEPQTVERSFDPPREGDLLRVTEALLFASPGPLSTSVIAELVGVERGAVREILNRLQELYSKRNGGLVVREVAGGFGLYSVPEASPYISRMIRSQVSPRLTRAALESLAIVAYLQPVSRGVITEIRGVQSDGVVKTLEERGLIVPVGRGGPPGYPVLFGTSDRFLERFGLNSLDELPPLESHAPDQETVERIRRSLSWELMEEGGSVRHREAGEDPEASGEGRDGIAARGGSLDRKGEGDGEREEGEPR